MNVLVIGQSNAVRWFRTGEGAAAFTATLSEALEDPVSLINAAVGSSALLPVSDRNWSVTGPLYQRMLDLVRDVEVDAVVWIQGETDAAAGVSATDYCAGLEDLFSRLRADLGDVPVVLQELAIAQPGGDAIRQAQIEFSDGDPLTRAYAAAGSSEVLSNVHFNGAGYDMLGDRAARLLADILGADLDPVRQGNSAGNWMKGDADADRIYSLGGSDTIKGGDGRDALFGGGGADVICGGDGNDLISGGHGNDRLLGGSGQDKLFGDLGRDILSGGAGRDTYFVNGGDTITDYTAGEAVVIHAPRGGDLQYHGGRIYYDGAPMARLVGAPALDLADVDVVF